MAESELAGGAGRYEVTPNVGNHFAFIRTRLALERTMMAWVRTAVALIGFGFTIVQFFERLAGMEGVAAGCAAGLASLHRARTDRHGCGRPGRFPRGNTTGWFATCGREFRLPACNRAAARPYADLRRHGGHDVDRCVRVRVSADESVLIVARLAAAADFRHRFLEAAQVCSSERCTRSRSTSLHSSICRSSVVAWRTAVSIFVSDGCDSIAHFPHAQMNLQLDVVDDSLPPRDPRDEQRFDSLVIGAVLRRAQGATSSRMNV